MRANTTEGTTRTDYVYVGHDPWYERSKSGTTQITTDYIYVNGGLKAKIVGGGSSPGTYFYITDALGSVRQVWKQGATTAAFSVATYKPFGTPVTVTGTEKVEYAGELIDSASGTFPGLYYIGARWMDPELGRFVSMDPKAGDTRSPQSLDRHVYCFNNPLRFTDPTGEKGGGKMGHPRKCPALADRSSDSEAHTTAPVSEWRIYPIMAIEAEVPVPGAEGVQVSLGAEFIGIIDVYQNVEPIKLHGVTIGYEFDVYWYAYVGTPGVEAGSPIVNAGFFWGPDPMLENGVDIGMVYPHLETNEKGSTEGFIFEAEVGSATGGAVVYVTTMRMFVSIFNIAPLPTLW
jgi:RHS repeat-associated protein